MDASGEDGDGYVLRAAGPDDGAPVAGVFGAARAGMPYLPRLHSPEEDVAYFTGVVLATSHVTVATTIDGVIGFSAVKDGWLDHLYVDPGAQGRGIGGALLRAAKLESPAGLSLWVFAANVRALAFYGRAGFVEILRTDGSRNEERQPDVQMHWTGTGAATGTAAAPGS